MSKINKDVLFFILNELKYDKNDNKSLFPYLLVNKLWCETTIPILWSDPWKYSKNDKKLFKIILSHLSKNLRKFLINEGINFIPKKQRNLLFDYISFCKYVMVHQYLRKYPLNNSQSILLEKEIYKLFMEKCSTIITLDLDLTTCPIYQLPGANVSLSKLCELSCVTTLRSSFFYGLAQICELIEEIHILLKNDNSGLAKLIEVQKQIKYLKIHVLSDNNEYQSIAQALEKQAHSILRLELWMSLFFPHFLFPKLINLQTLLILDGERYSNREAYEEYLSVAIYSKLEILELSKIPLDIATDIIQNTDGNLLKILIQGKVDSNNSKEYLQAIKTYCPNVEYISIFVNDQNFDEFEMLLINCNCLKGIDVRVDGRNFNGDKFLDSLVRLAPASLYEILIDLRRFTIKSLELFFESWRGRKPLCLYFLKAYWIQGWVPIHSNEIFDLMKKYKSEGVIKKYIKNFIGFWEVDKRSKITWLD